MVQCRECDGRGQVLRKPTLGESVPEASWMKCQPCKGTGKGRPTLLPWTPSRGVNGKPVADHCDQCGKPAALWSFQLADDEAALCVRCLKELRAAIAEAIGA